MSSKNSGMKSRFRRFRDKLTIREMPEPTSSSPPMADVSSEKPAIKTSGSVDSTPLAPSPPVDSRVHTPLSKHEAVISPPDEITHKTAHETAQDTSSTPDADAELPNLWTRASESLKNDSSQEKRDLIARYFEIMKSELGTDDATRIDVASHLNQKGDELNRRSLMISWGPHQANVKAVFNNTARHIIAAKDVITSAANADPHAALACAGGLVLLTFLIRPVEQREQLLEGLELTSSVIARHAEFDPRTRISRLPNRTDRVEDDLESHLIRLYAKVLEVQARALCYVQRDRTSQFVRDMFRGPTWKDLVAQIKGLDHRGREPGTLAFQERVHNFMDDTSDAQKQAQHEELQRRRSDILKVLYKCPYEDRKNINPERAPGTCEWFVQHHLFREWKASDQSSLLWVSADPGCGKSVLSRYLVDEVLPTKEELVICFFFFKEDFPDQRKAPLALCVILWQLFTKMPLLLTEPIIEKFENAGNPLTESFASLFQILLTATSGSEVPICCLIDALDECQESDRRDFITGLNKFYLSREERQSLKFIVTSRPELKIQRGFQRLENVWPQIHLRGEDDAQVAKISGEIDIFARIRIQAISESLRLTTSEAEFLRSEVMQVRSRTYLWVHVALNVIENMLEFTKTTVQQVLRNLPEGLDRLYEKILSRSQDVAKARKLLHIVLAAPRPLALEEMSVALSINQEHHYYEEVELEPLDRFKDSIRAICGLFITIVDGRIYFIHQTAKEFLVPQSEQILVVQPTPATGLEPFFWKHTFDLSNSHLILAQICIWHLNLQNDFILMHPLKHGKKEHRQFFEYSARYWHEHLRNSGVGKGSEITEMASQLCIASCSDTPNPWFWAWLLFLGYKTNPKVEQILLMDQMGIFVRPTFIFNRTIVKTSVPDYPTPCIVAAACGLETILRDMVVGNDNAYLESDELCRTALWWAARQGHSEVVRFLLKSDTTPEHDQKSFYVTANLIQDGMTPLMLASELGDLSTVQVLLEDPRICLSVTDLHSETALLHALSRGEELVAEALLGRNDALFNLTDDEMWDVFRVSVWHGYPYVSEFIANRLPPEFENRFGQSPILFVISDYFGPTKLGLLKTLHRMRKFDITATDEDKRSAVWWAASTTTSSVEVLKWLLLDLGLDIESSDSENQTPFSQAASQLHISNLDLLFRCGKVDVNSRNASSCTPLMQALQRPKIQRLTNTYGNMFDVVRFLLSKGASLNSQDDDGCTALMYAAWLGCSEVVKLLVHRGALVNIKNRRGKTALEVARKARQDAKRYGRFYSSDTVEMLLWAGAEDGEDDNALLGDEYGQDDSDDNFPAGVFDSLDNLSTRAFDSEAFERESSDKEWSSSDEEERLAVMLNLHTKADIREGLDLPNC